MFDSLNRPVARCRIVGTTSTVLAPEPYSCAIVMVDKEAHPIEVVGYYVRRCLAWAARRELLALSLGSGRTPVIMPVELIYE